MKIPDVLGSAWAIEPGKLIEIREVYDAHARGDKIDLAGVEARIGKPLANEQRRYDVINGVAIVPVEGVLAKKMNLMTAISGGSSSQIIAGDLRAALDDPSVHSIILAVDSPGGTVDGTQTLADTVRAARDEKPIVALASGCMASAAYWIGSAASEVYIADGTTVVGSIGVVATHVDVSGAESARGVKTTEITAGKFKRIDSQYAPLTTEGQQTLQERVDYQYSQFVAAVATNRGVSTDKVLTDMADGRIFIGQQAVDAGLVDGITTMDALIARLNDSRGSSAPTARAGTARTPAQPKRGTSMNAEQIAAAHPEAAAALRAEGATAERERIQAVEAQLVPGHEALITTMKFDGKSSGGDAAIAVLAAEKKARTTQSEVIKADAPKPVAQTAAPTSPTPEATALTREELDAKAKEHMAANPGVSYVAAYKAVGGK